MMPTEKGGNVSKIMKEFFSITRNLLKTKLISRNSVKVMRTWLVSIVRFTGSFREKIDVSRISRFTKYIIEID